jgi:hypothetical protein
MQKLVLSLDGLVARPGRFGAGGCGLGAAMYVSRPPAKAS